MTIRKLKGYYCSDIIIGLDEIEGDNDIFILQGEDAIYVQQDELEELINVLRLLSIEGE